MKKIIWIIVIIALILITGFLFFVFRASEDTWIKDSKGIWIKNGNPYTTPNSVNIQRKAIACALDLYNKAKENGMEFNSQCLGACEDYSIDIVHVPRTECESETNCDNNPKNQCSDFKEGRTEYFIELDKDRNIVRIVD